MLDPKSYFSVPDSCSSSLKLSRLPPPDLRPTRSVKVGPRAVQPLQQQSQLTDARDARRINRLARAITPPHLISHHTAPSSAPFDFFNARPDKRWSMELWLTMSCAIYFDRFSLPLFCSCLSEFDLPGAGTLLGGCRSIGDVGEIGCILAVLDKLFTIFNVIISFVSRCSPLLTPFLSFSKTFRMVFATSKDAAPLVEQCPLWPPPSKMCHKKYNLQPDPYTISFNLFTPPPPHPDRIHGRA